MKIDRLLSILLLLLKRDRVTAPELAAYFETSPRTIYRDMETLCQAGIPVCSEQGTGGGYYLMPGFTLDRQVLKVDELLTLLAGLKGLQDIGDEPSLRRTYEKVSAVTPAERETLEINFFGWDGDGRIRNRVRQLHGAVRQSQPVRFRYTNLQNESILRETEPHKLFFRGSGWYLLAWCRVREAFRFFRISRMEDLELLPGHFTPRPMTEDDWDPARLDAPAEEVRLRISRDAAVRAKEFFSSESMVEEEDGSLLICVPFPPDEWLYSYLLGYGASLTVLHPPSLREELVRRAEIFIKKNTT